MTDSTRSLIPQEEDLYLSPEAQAAWNTKLQLAAQRLKERCSSIPWHAERAAREKAKTGDEMTYWMSLAASCPNIK